jgi:hypothetical protein
LGKPSQFRRRDLTFGSFGRSRRLGPLTGGYYWVPIPGAESIAWSVLTCHDLGFGPDYGHHDMWPSVTNYLARTWGREPGPLRDRLENCYRGLPHGRINRTDGRFLLLHGDEVPVSDWLERVVEQFILDGRAVALQYSEHYETISRHRRAVNAEFGLSIVPSRTGGKEESC